MARAGLCGYGPSPIAVLGRLGIVTVQEEPVVTEASCGDYHAIRAYGLAIQYDAAHTTVFVCVQRGHAPAPRNVDIAAVDLAVQHLCQGGAVARCLVASRNAFHPGGIQFSPIGHAASWERGCPVV